MKLPIPLLAAACLWAFSSSPSFAANTTVHVGPNGSHTFSPQSVTINVGDTVHWIVDSGTHTTTSATGQVETWDSSFIGQGQPFDHTFTHAGTFNYYCQIHGFENPDGSVGGMSGNVIVTGSNTTTAPALASFTVSPSSVIGGFTANGTATLTAPAPMGGASISISTGIGDDLVFVFSGINIPAGATSGKVAIQTSFPGNTPFTANVSASYNGTTKVAKLTVLPPSGLSGISIIPGTVIGGTTLNATVTFAAAVANQTVVTLKSTDTSATVPATLTIAKGKTSGSFAIKTVAVTKEKMPLISASSAGITKSAMLMIEPVEIQAISVSPSTVIGGNTSNGNVTLNLPPPAAVTVNLTSSNTTAKLSAKSVSIAKGKTSGTFKVTTTKVTKITTAKIGASVTGSSANTTLTIDPPAK